VNLQGLPPLIAPHTRLLILGSFPGVKSLQTQQYYGHPRNQFWRLIFSIISPASAIEYCASSYEIRSKLLLQAGLGCWDVYAHCERVGSLDSAIRNAQRNDFALLIRLCPQLQAIAHNGAESYSHVKYTQALGVAVYKLPSSSPAHATWSFERKRLAWHDAIAPHLKPI
jgi:hypoxanthine-DNA glycosylase